MKIENSSQPNLYKIDSLSISQLKTIRDACVAYSKQGSSIAGTLAMEIAQFMDNIVV